jgi:hypothetical protein
VAGLSAPVEVPATRRAQGRSRSVLNSAVVFEPNERRLAPPPDPTLTRHNVANRVLWGYLVLLGAVVATPIALLLIKGTSVDDASKITIALSSTLSGLAGVLGYVMGFYFKGEEQKGQAAAAEAQPAARRDGSRSSRSTRGTNK